MLHFFLHIKIIIYYFTFMNNKMLIRCLGLIILMNVFTYCFSDKNEIQTCNLDTSRLSFASMRQQIFKLPDSIAFENDTIIDTYGEPEFTPEFAPFSRDSIKMALQTKIDSGIPLVIHLFVPLCDNKNQGIVPVPEKIGNGLNPKTNLYWGAGYGIKNHFRRRTSWQKIKETAPLDSTILERVIFYRRFTNEANVYLIADAYRGDKMEACLSGFFYSLTGEKQAVIAIDTTTIEACSKADLLVFNGHNGLMDLRFDYRKNKDGIKKDAAVISCYSDMYFSLHLNYAGGYPLVTTTGLLAPEAYITEAFFESWALMKSDDEIRISAGDAYDKYQSCSQKAARALFRTGW